MGSQPDDCRWSLWSSYRRFSLHLREFQQTLPMVCDYIYIYTNPVIAKCWRVNCTDCLANGVSFWIYMGYDNQCHIYILLTLRLPGPSAGVSGSLDSYCSLKPLCSGMGEVVPARTAPTLLPPSPRTVLSLSCFKVSQCINCRDWHFKG